MPRITTAAEDLLLMIGEAIQDDLDCWEVDGDTLTVTFRGETFTLRAVPDSDEE